MESPTGSGAEVYVELPRTLVLVVMSAASDVGIELTRHPVLAARFWSEQQVDALFDKLAARLGPVDASSVALRLSRDEAALLRSLPSAFLEVVEDWEINARTGDYREDFERAQLELDARLGPLLDGAAGS